MFDLLVMRISQIPVTRELPRGCGMVRIQTTSLKENAGPQEAGFLNAYIYSI
jgi:hypothetical protein